MSLIKQIAMFLIATLLIACSGEKIDYPNWPTQRISMQNGQAGLANWRPCESSENICIQPDHDSFDHAVAWFQQVEQKDPKKAAKVAVRKRGMKSVKVLSVSRVDQKAFAMVEPDKSGRAHAVMVKGKLEGKDARAILLIWYGRFGHQIGQPSNSGVHAFMAPTPAFEALGGMAVPGILWFGGTTDENENMLEDGKLHPDAATKKLASFHAAWARNYEQNLIAQQMMFNMQMQTMQIQQQTINQMQSYNNALQACAGVDCSMSMNSDGTWSADIE